jgi:hypothetical protein
MSLVKSSNHGLNLIEVKSTKTKSKENNVNTVIKHSRHNNGPGYEVKKEKEKRNEEIPYQSLIEHTQKIRFDSFVQAKT